MTASGGDARLRHIVPEMFTGPGKIRFLNPVLRRLPGAVSRELLAVLAVTHGLVARSRWRRASTWAAAHSASRTERYRLALTLLANHGRFVGDEMMIGMRDVGDLTRNVVIEGRERLDALGGGAILLGFHLGPPKTGLTLSAFGYPVHTAGRLRVAEDNPQWNDALSAGDAVRLAADTPRARAEGLYRLRNLLQDGAWIYLAAEGIGRRAFAIDVPGGALPIRAGWLALRRATAVPVLPVLAYRDGATRVIAVHPALPPPGRDRAEDEARCRDILGALVNDYVRRFPEQCRYVAIPSTTWGEDTMRTDDSREIR